MAADSSGIPVTGWNRRPQKEFIFIFFTGALEVEIYSAVKGR